jgi:hypothetical protein
MPKSTFSLIIASLAWYFVVVLILICFSTYLHKYYGIVLNFKNRAGFGYPILFAVLGLSFYLSKKYDFIYNIRCFAYLMFILFVVILFIPVSRGSFLGSYMDSVVLYTVSIMLPTFVLF